ncbi:MAG TPA: hypothetical protein VFQ38_23870 [Longimicrobiales bacterium]|nr:hypothetical protein [Longimicrobiales bacterium]
MADARGTAGATSLADIVRARIVTVRLGNVGRAAPQEREAPPRDRPYPVEER